MVLLPLSGPAIVMLSLQRHCLCLAIHGVSQNFFGNIEKLCFCLALLLSRLTITG